MPERAISSDTPRQQRRPRVLTFLSILFLLSGFFYLLKFSQAVARWGTLASLPITVSPAYLAIDGLLWGLAGLFLAWSLWTGKSWSRFAGIIISLVFTAVFWIDQIWISEPEILQTRWLFNLILTIIGLSGIVLILNIKSSRAFFEKTPAKIN